MVLKSPNWVVEILDDTTNRTPKGDENRKSGCSCLRSARPAFESPGNQTAGQYRRIHVMCKQRHLLVLAIVFSFLVAGCSNTDPLGQGVSTDDSVVSSSSGGGDSAVADPALSMETLEAVQGRWLLTSAPGFEESHGATITLTDGPETGDRYIELEMHSTCISIFDYAIDGSTLTTKGYFGEVTMEGCIEPPPAFAALFELNSELQVSVTEDTLKFDTADHILGLVRIDRFAEVPRAPVAIRDTSGEDGSMEALFIGTLEIGESCTYAVEEQNDGTEDRLLVAFDSQRTTWDYEDNVLLGDDGSGTFTEFSSGDRVEMGGGSVQLDLDTTTWVIPPHPTCDTSQVWLASVLAKAE